MAYTTFGAVTSPGRTSISVEVAKQVAAALYTTKSTACDAGGSLVVGSPVTVKGTKRGYVESMGHDGYVVRYADGGLDGPFGIADLSLAITDADSGR